LLLIFLDDRRRVVARACDGDETME
jgi:hypothetical protein